MRTLVLLAAGTGSRLGLGHNKMLYEFEDKKTMLETTIDIFYNVDIFDEYVIVYNEQDENIIKKKLLEYNNIKYVKGTGFRHNSVYEGVKVAKNDIVYIHDGARCNFNKKYLKKFEEEVKRGYKCVILGVPLKDTVSLVENDIICSNLKRESLIAIQTPQVIDKNTYMKIYKDKLYTDESSLYFENGYDVKVIQGDYKNIKITTIEDLQYFEFLKNKLGE